MKKNDSSGILIAVDGIDGAGKTTQVNLLAQVLEKVGESVMTTKEPTDGYWGMKIRSTVRTKRLPLEDELEAFIEDRKEHIERKILPALQQGKIVILDRYLYSTIAYQGIRSEFIEHIESLVKKDTIEPDMVFIMDIDPRIAAIRITDRDGSPNEFEKLEDQIKVRALFKVLCEKDKLLTVMDGNRSIEDVSKSIIDSFVNGALKQKKCVKSYGCDDPVYCSFRMLNQCQWFNIKSKIIGLQK